jgi:uridylate kinase
MNAQSVKKYIQTEPTKLQSLVTYPELSNSELEVVCGGGNIFRHHEESPQPKN